MSQPGMSGTKASRCSIPLRYDSQEQQCMPYLVGGKLLLLLNYPREFLQGRITLHFPARVTVVNIAKMAKTIAPLRDVLYDLTAFIHRVCRQYFVC